MASLRTLRTLSLLAMVAGALAVAWRAYTGPRPAVDATGVKDADARLHVLVLGSDGLIGSALVERLERDAVERRVRILHVRHRRHIDLREPDALAVFDERRIDFAFFLACEVGGAKFLDGSGDAVQLAMLESNVAMYSAVMPYLARRKIPFLFASSYAVAQGNTAYSLVKQLGEMWLTHQGVGKAVRFWNVYGLEPQHLEAKRHVLWDWALACAEHGDVRARSSGLERRQFTFVDDIAEALVLAMQQYDSLPPVTDVSNGEWISLRDVAAQLETASEGACHVAFSQNASEARPELEPRLDAPLHASWRARVDLAEGVRRVLAGAVADAERNGRLSGERRALWASRGLIE